MGGSPGRADSGTDWFSVLKRADLNTGTDGVKAHREIQGSNRQAAFVFITEANK